MIIILKTCSIITWNKYVTSVLHNLCRV